jgi:hypothetical protein
MDEIRVLGQFVPSAWHDETIQQEFRALPALPRCCRCERISVRLPQGIPPPENNLHWHQDGGGADGTTQHMVIWASEQPTELKTSTGAVVPIQPLDVVWFDNTKAWHQQPTGTNETTRWFVAIRCSGAIF